MTQQRNYLRICFSILLLISFNSFSQEPAHKDVSEEVLTTAARDIIAGAGTCALITLDANGLPSVRVMDPFLPESDFTVWLGTNPNSGKVSQIKNNPKVTLYYLEKNSSGYVVIHGKAQLIDDQSEKDARWKNEWKAFYPNNNDAYLLIKVTPKWMEVVSYEHGIIGDPTTWQAPKVLFDSIK